MSYMGGRLSAALAGVPWPVSQSSQVLALFGVFVDVGLRAGVPLALMAFARIFLTTAFCLFIFLVLCTPWLLFMVR